MQPSDSDRRIETSIDSEIRRPIHYSWNLTYERSLPKGFVIQASYMGRAARHPLVARDVAALNDFVDPKSGMDWYTADGNGEDYRRQIAPTIDPYLPSSQRNLLYRAAMATIPPFLISENLFGGISGWNASLLGGRLRASWASNATQAVFGDALRSLTTTTGRQRKVR